MPLALLNGDEESAWSPPAGCVLWLCGAKSGAIGTGGTWLTQAGTDDFRLVAGATVLATDGLVMPSIGDYAYALTHNNIRLNGTAAFSVILWRYRIAQATEHYFGDGEYASNGWYWPTYGGMQDLRGPTFVLASGTQPPAGWAHLAIIRGAGAAPKLYLDGIDVTLAGGNLNIPAATRALTLGAYAGNPATDGGQPHKIDDVMVWNRAIGTDELSDAYANSPGSHAP